MSAERLEPNKIIHGHNRRTGFQDLHGDHPADKPKYLYLTIYDDPQAMPKDHGYHTAAYNAGRVAGALIRRVEPSKACRP